MRLCLEAFRKSKYYIVQHSVVLRWFSAAICLTKPLSREFEERWATVKKQAPQEEPFGEWGNMSVDNNCTICLDLAGIGILRVYFTTLARRSDGSSLYGLAWSEASSVWTPKAQIGWLQVLMRYGHTLWHVLGFNVRVELDTNFPLLDLRCWVFPSSNPEEGRLIDWRKIKLLINQGFSRCLQHPI